MSGLPKLIRGIEEWRAECANLRSRGNLGFVPTMGALHRGHASLFERSAAENAATAASIFVNPTQFNDPKDLSAYPRTLEADLALAGESGVDAVFFPDYQALYPDGYRYKVTEGELSKRWCGAFRPGHFDGVLTVVLKLLSLTGADRAYFGEKDWQQYLLVRDMTAAFFLKTEIVPCPIVREDDGLAMSSRNARLSPEARARASAIYRALTSSPSAADAAARLQEEGFQVEYVEDWTDPASGARRRLAAAFLDGVRLIDNVALAPSKGERA